MPDSLHSAAGIPTAVHPFSEAAHARDVSHLELTSAPLRENECVSGLANCDAGRAVPRFKSHFGVQAGRAAARPKGRILTLTPSPSLGCAEHHGFDSFSCGGCRADYWGLLL
ncbi:unnamed protein product [Polarella glacialis]|uniref:Uncharacterized protein n=1 Tax=Polarella glacialis TaxID=89957 RepID=A0A813K1T5_POLGL|nr:unnamed protein product [Polarella glacialis]